MLRRRRERLLEFTAKRHFSRSGALDVLGPARSREIMNLGSFSLGCGRGEIHLGFVGFLTFAFGRGGWF